MFSLREYLTAIFTLPNNCVDETAVEHGLRDVAAACQTWGRDMRIRKILFELRVSL